MDLCLYERCTELFSLCFCSSEPIHVSNNKKGIVRAKHFHANITIFEEDNQSCLFCFTAFTLSAIQVFIMKQDGVWNIVCNRGKKKKNARIDLGLKHQQNWFWLAGKFLDVQCILCVFIYCCMALLVSYGLWLSPLEKKHTETLMCEYVFVYIKIYI